MYKGHTPLSAAPGGATPAQLEEARRQRSKAKGRKARLREAAAAKLSRDAQKKLGLTRDRRHTMTATEVYGDDDSFSYLDYTPVTAKRPVKMTDQLRVASSAHKTKIALCITCYNEDADELHRTLEGIAANLTALEDGDHVTWNEIVVFVVFDGVRKMHKSMKEYAEESLLIFDPNMLCTDVDGQKVNMHLFERTVLLQRHEAQDTYFKPLQLVFAIKQHNGGKLNSHLWYFSGFCRQ